MYTYIIMCIYIHTYICIYIYIHICNIYIYIYIERGREREREREREDMQTYSNACCLTKQNMCLGGPMPLAQLYVQRGNQENPQ